ncbi:MAG: FISUMP domain-containing protein [Candidatus Zixiibacteriota bacterium]
MKNILIIFGLILSLSSNSFSQTSTSQFSTFTDPRDNNIYKSVQIGDKIWMAENLRYATNSGSWCWKNEEDSCITRGRLYNWETAMQSTPPGWHIPTDAEWKELETTLGLTVAQADMEGFRWDKDSTIAGKMKLTGAWTEKYNGKKISITNESGFCAVITGFYVDNTFTHDGYTAWWTSTAVDSSAWIRHIGFFDNSIGRVLNKKIFAFPVRCIKDK